MRNDKKLLFASLIYAISFYLAFNGWYFLIFIASASIYYIILQARNLNKKLLYTILASFLSIFTSMHFVSYTIASFSKMGLVPSYLLLILFSLLSTGALFIFVVISHFILKFNMSIFITPFTILLGEAIDWKVFPWDFGSALIQNNYLAQTASLIGSRGLSFIVFLYALFIYQIFYEKKGRLKTLFILLGLLLLQLGYGYLVIKPLNYQKKIKALLVQANIGNSAKLSIEERLRLSKFLPHTNLYSSQDLILNTYIKLSKDAIRKDVDIVFWPETAFPSFYREKSFYTRKLKRLTEDLNKTFIFGAYYSEKKHIFNSIIQQGPFSKFSIYKKRILLPFGEYMPLGDLFPKLYSWFPAVSHFTPGRTYKVFQYKDFKMLPIICYEALFPRFVAEQIKNKKVDLIVHITNDSWFSESGAKYHLLLSRARAIENRRPILRITNTGFSASIDRYGRILKQTKFNEQTTIDTTVDLTENTLTIYTRYHRYLLAFVMLGYIIYLAFFIWNLRRKNARNNE